MKIKMIMLGVEIFIAVFSGVFFFMAYMHKKTNDAPNGGPFANDSRHDFMDHEPVEITREMLRACVLYAESLGYAIIHRDRYRSVLLGESLLEAVHTGGEYTKRAMIDENDYLVIFDEIRIVVDAETGVVLGHVPYV